MTDLTRDALIQAVRDEISGWPIGCGYYQTTIGTDEAKELAPVVVGAVLRLLTDMADQWNAQSDRESEAADRWGGYHAGARSARMDCERDLRSLLPEGDQP